MLLSLLNKYKLEHLRATLNNIETLKDQVKYILYNIIGGYSDNIPGLGFIIRV